LAVRVGIKPDRLRAYKLMTGDVVDALRRQNTEVAAGGAIGGQGRGLQRIVNASGRLTKVEQFENVILRANPDGEVLRLKDVARVSLSPTLSGFSRVDGKPSALIAVTAWPGRVTADQLLKVEDFVDLPPGMRLDVAVNRTVDRLLEVEVRLPDGTQQERTEMIIEKATETIHALAGKPGTVALVEGLTPNAATIFIKLPQKGGPSAADVKKAFAAFPDAALRVGDVRPGGEAFPVRLALTARAWVQGEEEALHEDADRVVAALMKEPMVTGPAAFPGPLARHFDVNIDRDKCATMGVELDSVLTTLQASLGGLHATNFSKYGRSLRVMVQAQPQFARQIEDLEMLFVRSERGEMVPLDKLLKIQKALAPSAVVRVNGYRAVIVTAAPAAGKTPAEATARCIKLAQEVLPRGNRVKDLTGSPK
jgi:multidrug efflux pump subunit AcrB